MFRNLSFTPKVSIVIPVFNGANYLSQAINSALGQTYVNLEVIVVNDGSNDNGATKAIAESYGSRIRYFEKSNGGVASALNLAISKMEGNYFSWLSHDDIYSPLKVERQVEVLSSLDTSDRINSIVYSDYFLINEKSERFWDVRISEHHPLAMLQMPFYPLLNGLLHGCSLLVPRVAFEKYGFFQEDLRFTQDYDLWLKFLKNMRICYCPEVLIGSRVHPEQDSKKPSVSERRDYETNVLWRNVHEEVCEIEATKMYGNLDSYYRKSLSFLGKINVPGAYDLVVQRWLNNWPLVSIVIPFFNRISFTEEAVKSVLKQTYKNIEIILVDDGSTDDVSPITSLALSDSRIIFLQQVNKGAAAARNLGVKKAKGSFLCFLDSDDKFLPQKIEKQLTVMVALGLDFSHTSYFRIDELGVPYELVESGSISHEYPSMFLRCAIATPTVMVRKSVIEEHPFPEGTHVGEDVITWSRIAKKYRLVGIGYPLTQVRILKSTTAFDPVKLSVGLKNIKSAYKREAFMSWFYFSSKGFLLHKIEKLRRFLPLNISSAPSWLKFILHLVEKNVRKIIYLLPGKVQNLLRRIYRKTFR